LLIAFRSPYHNFSDQLHYFSSFDAHHITHFSSPRRDKHVSGAPAKSKMLAENKAALPSK
jgi:hypothetical protein